MPAVHAELIEALERLERHYGDIQDVEYTVEDGRLFILQTRSAKRHALAAVRFAVDAVDEGMLDREDALRTIDPGGVGALLHRSFAPDARFTQLTRGVGASPGAAKGGIVFSPEAAERQAADGEDVILVRPFTSADDVGGFHAARGILTAQGGEVITRGDRRPRDGPPLRLRRLRTALRGRRRARSARSPCAPATGLRSTARPAP